MLSIDLPQMERERFGWIWCPAMAIRLATLKAGMTKGGRGGIDVARFWEGSRVRCSGGLTYKIKHHFLYPQVEITYMFDSVRYLAGGTIGAAARSGRRRRRARRTARPGCFGFVMRLVARAGRC